LKKRGGRETSWSEPKILSNFSILHLGGKLVQMSGEHFYYVLGKYALKNFKNNITICTLKYTSKNDNKFLQDTFQLDGDLII